MRHRAHPTESNLRQPGSPNLKPRCSSVCGRRRVAAGMFASLLSLVLASSTAPAEEASLLRAAMDSVTSTELYRHVEVLADDIYEGREGGSRGGRAAANYIGKQLAEHNVQPAGSDGKFFQPFHGSYRNILAKFPGTDVELKSQHIVVGAHYDHVGYGNRSNSYGPTGYIHNGADDNASGVAALLELIEALERLPQNLRRSVLIAFWDGEEKGLLGSNYWISHPTVSLNSVGLAVNIDMIGWLRDGRLEVGGTRSGYGLRRFAASRLPTEELWLDFNWELQENSDHWPFFGRNIPVLLLQHVSRYLVELVCQLANADELPQFRGQARAESPSTQRRYERPLGPPPPRLGIRWRPNADNATDEAGVEITGVMLGTPADQSGLSIGDRILGVNGEALIDSADLPARLLRTENEVVLQVVRMGAAVDDVEDISVTLAGTPSRLGISWRGDEAEPGSVYLTRVLRNSPAARAGLSVHDRIYELNGATFADRDELLERIRNLLAADVPEISFLVESRGLVRPVTVSLGP